MKDRKKRIFGGNMKYFATRKLMNNLDKQKKLTKIEKKKLRNSYLFNLLFYGNAKLNKTIGAFGKCAYLRKNN
jgi:hypothetical protein